MSEAKLQEAIQLIRSGRVKEGGQILKAVLKTDPRNELAWFWMSACVGDPEKKAFCLRKVLDINPNNQKARQALDSLSGGEEQPAQKQPTLKQPAFNPPAAEEFDDEKKARLPKIQFGTLSQKLEGMDRRVLIGGGAGAIVILCGGLFLVGRLLTGGSPGNQVAAASTPTETPADTPTITPTFFLADVSPVPTFTLTPSPAPFAGTECVPQDTRQELAALVRVIDGDKIDVIINGQVKTVRYLGVNGPDVGEPLYAEAVAFTQSLLEGKTFTLVKDLSEIDVEGNLLRFVIVDEIFVNQLLLEEGHGMLDISSPDKACQNEFILAETAAKDAGRGIWALEGE